MSFVTIFEVRNSDGVTESLVLQDAVLDGKSNGTEVGASWTPSFADTFQLRVFAVSNLREPDIFSGVRTARCGVEEPPDESDESDSREIAIYGLLASDPRLAMYREGVYGHNEDYMPLRKEPSGAWVDEAVMHVVRQQDVEGDWQTGYNVTYSGLLDVKLEIRSAREILSIEEIPLANRTVHREFNDSDKEIIRAVLSNASVSQALQAKEKHGYSVFVSGVGYNGFFASSETTCPEGKCGRVHFQVENTKQVMVVWLNTETDVVGRISYSTEWQNDCRQFACRES